MSKPDPCLPCRQVGFPKKLPVGHGNEPFLFPSWMDLPCFRNSENTRGFLGDIGDVGPKRPLFELELSVARP